MMAKHTMRLVISGVCDDATSDLLGAGGVVGRSIVRRMKVVRMAPMVKNVLQGDWTTEDSDSQQRMKHGAGRFGC